MTRTRICDDEAVLRKRLAFRCRRGGMRELDVILGSFAESHLESLSFAQLRRLESLLGIAEVELYAWLCGRGALPSGCEHDVARMVRAQAQRIFNP